MRHHTPAIQELEVATPTLTPTQQHAMRRLRAHGIGPDGEPMVRSDQVRYSLPPAEGEAISAAARRKDRHLRREQNALERLNRRLMYGDVKLYLEQEESAVQEQMEMFRARAEQMRTEAKSAKAYALALEEGLWKRMTEEERECVEMAAKEREEALSSQAAERAEQREARRCAARLQAKQAKESAEREAAKEKMAASEAAATVVEVLKRQGVPSLEQILAHARSARLCRCLPQWSIQERQSQCETALHEIFMALHVPHHILFPKIPYWGYP